MNVEMLFNMKRNKSTPYMAYIAHMWKMAQECWKQSMRRKDQDQIH